MSKRNRKSSVTAPAAVDAAVNEIVDANIDAVADAAVERDAKIADLLAAKNAATTRNEQKRIRRQLRQLNYYLSIEKRRTSPDAAE